MCSIYGNGRVFKGIKENSAAYDSTAGWLNAAIILLLLGTIGLTVGAWRASVRDAATSPSAIARLAVAEMRGVGPEDVTVESLEKLDGGMFVLSARVNSTSQELFRVVVDSGRHEAVSVGPTPSTTGPTGGD